MVENWVPVPIATLCEYYEISDLGRFRSVKYRPGGGNPRVLKPKVMRDGYLFIRMNGDGGQQYFNAHRLVAATFVPNPFNKPHVNHINSVRSDNRVVNLEWVTPKENIAHALKSGAFVNSLANLIKRRARTVEFAICHPLLKAVGDRNQCKKCYMRDWRKANRNRLTAYNRDYEARIRKNRVQ